MMISNKLSKRMTIIVVSNSYQVLSCKNDERDGNADGNKTYTVQHVKLHTAVLEILNLLRNPFRFLTGQSIRPCFNLCRE